MSKKIKNKSKTAKGVVAKAPSASSASDSQVLPPNAASQFKQVLKYYEQKQYKKGIRAANTILDKHPDHGETLAMKGLTMNALEKGDEEAAKLIKRGLACNMKSHVCWHVLGLLHRSNQDYDQAIKCYQQALKRDAGNQQILKDLSLLQIQTRAYTGYTETRRKILVDKTDDRTSWVSYALGSHLAGTPTLHNTSGPRNRNWVARKDRQENILSFGIEPTFYSTDQK